ncbi:MAG: TIGR01458 family HAD-type hydrolase [Rhodospirillales bacterium]
MESIRAALLDLQGVLYSDGVPIDGARDAVAALAAGGIATRFVTNTTTRPRREIAERMIGMGFEIAANRVFSPAVAAAGVLREAGCSRVMLVAEASLAEDFAGFEFVDDNPDAVIMGDLHENFDWQCLNRIFDAVRNGAKLIALHRNRYCKRGDVIALDLGPFVAAIEYAANVEARVVGKPESAFFAWALRDIGSTPAEAVMVGDDPFSDIDGAAGAGLHTVQVKTGKYIAGEQGKHVPDAVIDSVADLPALLGV